MLNKAAKIGRKICDRVDRKNRGGIVKINIVIENNLKEICLE